MNLASSTAPPPFDLSRATKLEPLRFWWGNPDVRRITTTFETAKSESLREIIIHAVIDFRDSSERVRREWKDLDCLLVKLWTSRSVLPKILPVTCVGDVWEFPDELIVSLLPQLANRGAIDAVRGV